MDRPVEWQGDARPVHIAVGPVTLEGNLSVPERAGGVVLFAHGSGSSRHSPAIAMWHSCSTRRSWQRC
jgi:putative phosphoribosyl transferase